MSYNPSDVGVKGTIFGYPYSQKEAELILIPVPWDVTVSYGHGTARGPGAILDASPQLDHSIPGVENPWNFPVHMLDIPAEIHNLSSDQRKIAKVIIEQLEKGNENIDPEYYDQINSACEKMNQYVYQTSVSVIEQGKFPAVIGGDHSTPLGLIKALSEKYSFGILQFDAHLDLRKAYEGFEYSHASIMYNALQNSNVTKLVQVGIRDYCQEETEFIENQGSRVKVFYDEAIKNSLLTGGTWNDTVNSIIDQLPENIYISFDIDGLDPSLCPNTGTPVPGGLRFEEINFLLNALIKKGKQIIGFDLVEVTPSSENDEWDANVGARILYRLCTALGMSNSKLKFAK